jgi:transposase
LLLSDARWALIAHRLTAWRQARTDAGVGCRTATHDLREIFNAILYVYCTGAPWRYLPHDLPPWQTVYWYFQTWTNDGIFTDLNYELTGLVRHKSGRNSTPRRPAWTPRASRPPPTSRPPRRAPTPASGSSAVTLS